MTSATKANVDNGVAPEWYKRRFPEPETSAERFVPEAKQSPKKIFTMRKSLVCIILAAALLLHSCCASPADLAQGGSLEQDAFTSLLSEEVTENGRGEAAAVADGKTRGQRVIVVADPGLWRDLRVLHNGLALYKRRADDNSQAVERTNGGQDLSIPILRRDTVRCMVGRVYRPCWEV